MLTMVVVVVMESDTRPVSHAICRGRGLTSCRAAQSYEQLWKPWVKGMILLSKRVELEASKLDIARPLCSMLHLQHFMFVINGPLECKLCRAVYEAWMGFTGLQPSL
jgi:hypothetical protein